MICNRPNTSTSDAPSWLGEPCPDCGHTSLAHPGITNLTLDWCLVCEVQAAIQLLNTTSTEDGSRLSELRSALAAETVRGDELEAAVQQLTEAVAQLMAARA